MFKNNQLIEEQARSYFNLYCATMEIGHSMRRVVNSMRDMRYGSQTTYQLIDEMANELGQISFSIRDDILNITADLAFDKDDDYTSELEPSDELDAYLSGIKVIEVRKN